MSRRDIQSEENFWPCVSDMFLALFVIALVLYSTKSFEKGKGDEYISQLAAKEACSLIETLKKKHPEVEVVQDIDLNSIRNEKGGSRPVLAKSLYQLLDCESLNVYFKKDYLPQEMLPHEEGELRFTHAICVLYMATSDDGKKRPDRDDPCYHEHMRAVRERIERVIMLSNVPGLEQMTDEELVAEIRKLRSLLANCVDRKELDDLQLRYDELTKICKDVEYLLSQLDEVRTDLQNAKNRIAELETQQKVKDELINDKDELIEKKDAEIAYWRGKFNKMVDLRFNVMEQIKMLLFSSEYVKLKQAGVTVKEHEGLIIVPSSVFSFPKATTRYYQQGKGIVTADLEKRLEHEVREENPQYLENLKLLAAFLDDIGKMVSSGDLPVDNIAIECHTDDDVSKITDKKFYNDGLSLQRAFDAWRLLDKYANGRLAQYRNADNQGLFSMTGFGMRVLPKRMKDETTSEYEERCRRMQIRFNCSPQRVDLQNEPSKNSENSKPIAPINEFGLMF